MKKPSFSVWAMLVTTVVVVLLCAGAVFLSTSETEIGTVVFSVMERQIVQMDVLITPAPTAEPIVLPEGAVDVLVDRARVALTLPSAAEAEQTLTAYLAWCMETVPQETERAVSAEFASDVHILPAGGNNMLSSPEAAMAKLREEPDLVPVKVAAQKREIATAAAETEMHDDGTLGKGLRMYTQLGQGTRTRTVTETEYFAGAAQNITENPPETIAAARVTIVRVGTYRAADPSGAPDKKQGAVGKSAAGLALALPVKGTVSSYFGTRSGVMHQGIDVTAKAGTAITAPGEGVVIFVGARSGYGTVIDIDHGGGFVSRLTHCENVTVERNQRVFSGEQVATLAPLTYGTGKPHLHYELLIDGVPFNPMRYLA